MALLFLACGLVLLPAYRFAGLGVDSTAYLTIAKHYLNGHWDEAINAYWSPLYSWLLVPLLGSGLDGSTALRLVCLVAGAGTLLGFRALSRQLRVAPALVDVASSGVAAYLLVFGLIVTTGLTPDVLLACFILLYLRSLWLRPRTLGNACAAGLFAGVGYLAKAYALPFFLFHFTATLACAGWKTRARFGVRRPLLRWAAGLMGFVLVAAPWAAVISSHHGRLTLGTTGPFNLSYMNPAARFPFDAHGLIPPPGPHALSGWDNPAQLPIVEWRWWRSPADFVAGLRAIRRNLVETTRHLSEQSGVAFALAIVGLASLLQARNLRRRKREVCAVIFAAVVYLGGYLLAARMVEARYLIPISLLAALCASVWADEERRRGSGRRVAFPLVAALALGYAWPFLHELLDGRPKGVSPRAIASSLSAVIKPYHRVASKDDWNNGLYLSYWLGARYYGSPSPDKFERQLSEHQIDFLVDWRPDEQDSDPPGRLMPSAWAGPPVVYDLRK